MHGRRYLTAAEGASGSVDTDADAAAAGCTAYAQQNGLSNLNGLVPMKLTGIWRLSTSETPGPGFTGDYNITGRIRMWGEGGL